MTTFVNVDAHVTVSVIAVDTGAFVATNVVAAGSSTVVAVVKLFNAFVDVYTVKSIIFSFVTKADITAAVVGAGSVGAEATVETVMSSVGAFVDVKTCRTNKSETARTFVTAGSVNAAAVVAACMSLT